jgi:hypothetical protein
MPKLLIGRPGTKRKSALDETGCAIRRAACLFALILPSTATAQEAAKPLVLKPGQAIAFAVSIADGKATAGAWRIGKLGALEPTDNEIVVGMTPRGKDDYSQLVILEKTAQPVDFVATAHIDKVVIDEREICGRLNAPFQQHIAGNSWSVVLRDFSVGKGECK